MRYIADPAADIALTSLQTYLEPRTYEQLVRLFGPHTSSGDGYKVSTEWVIRDTETEHVFTIYDWKMVKTYDPSGYTVEQLRAMPYAWHIGGVNGLKDGEDEHTVTAEFKKWVERATRAV